MNHWLSKNNGKKNISKVISQDSKYHSFHPYHSVASVSNQQITDAATISLLPTASLGKRKRGWPTIINKVPFDHSPFGWPPEIKKGFFWVLIKSDSVMSTIGGKPSSSPPLATQAAGTVHSVSSIPVTRLSLSVSVSVSLSYPAHTAFLCPGVSLASAHHQTHTHTQSVLSITSIDKLCLVIVW